MATKKKVKSKPKNVLLSLILRQDTQLLFWNCLNILILSLLDTVSILISSETGEASGRSLEGFSVSSVIMVPTEPTDCVFWTCWVVATGDLAG